MNKNKVKKVVGNFHGRDVYVWMDTRKRAQACRAFVNVGSQETYYNFWFVAIRDFEPRRDLNGDVMFFTTAKIALKVAS